VRHFVVCPSQLEAENWLQVLALKQHIGIESGTERDGMGQWCFFHNVVDPGCQDKASVLSRVRKLAPLEARKLVRLEFHWVVENHPGRRNFSRILIAETDWRCTRSMPESQHLEESEEFGVSDS
jgi:hypothetical protein